MKVIFTAEAWRDYAQWLADDPSLLARINVLIAECLRHPFSGTGKPEPLKRNMAGWWSRRINREHRLVYRMSGSGDGQTLEVLSCRYHHCTSDYVRDLMRRDQDAGERVRRLQAAIDEGLASPVVETTVEEIIARGRARHAAA